MTRTDKSLNLEMLPPFMKELWGSSEFTASYLFADIGSVDLRFNEFLANSDTRLIRLVMAFS